MKTAGQLKSLLMEIDRRSYPAYKETKGSYRFEGYVLNIEHVQGDPFAAPSKLSISVDAAAAAFPEECYKEKHRRVALADLLLRGFARVLGESGRKGAGSGKSGLVACSRPGQEILERSGLVIREKDGQVLVRFEVGFPAAGRSIRSGELIKILFDFLPEAVRKSLLYRAYRPAFIEERMALADDQKCIRDGLDGMGLCAFVADGAILPRETGVSNRPMKGAVAFASPASLAVTIPLSEGKSITGMGIKKGISLIVGGGYHGKSTLLKALEAGVYNHIKGDGREYVITDPTAFKIRAEDGRSVRGTDISMFISNLPNKKDTKSFYTEDASGSTSEAANVMEALTFGSRVLLIDEDTCATNFMVRDALMQMVVSRDREPITPFLEKMRSIYEDLGVSIVLVAGSQGDFFRTADTIIQMDNYVPVDITERAKEIADAYSGSRPADSRMDSGKDARIPIRNGRVCGDRVKMKVLGKDAFMVNHETVDIRYVEQVVDSEQTAAIAKFLIYLHGEVFDGRKSLDACMEILGKLLKEKGFEFLDGGRNVPGNLAMPRIQEIYAAVNRCRWTEMR
ncbi:MAG: ABC-ATPase domain-containing protein [Lachnospiraceae bacterium]|nr:ABC-ATPase domain-containing protein [Lachnospiraceae bacterium]